MGPSEDNNDNNNDKPPPLVVAGSSEGGIVAAQYAAELGARLLFLRHSSIKKSCFDRGRVDRLRPKNAEKTRVLVVNGSGDGLLPLSGVHEELNALADENADIFEAPVLLVQQNQGHGLQDVDLVPLAVQLVRPPFNMAKEEEEDLQYSLYWDDWFDIADGENKLDYLCPPQWQITCPVQKHEKQRDHITKPTVPGWTRSIIIPRSAYELGGYLWQKYDKSSNTNCSDTNPNNKKHGSILSWDAFPSPLNDSLHPDVRHPALSTHAQTVKNTPKFKTLEGQRCGGAKRESTNEKSGHNNNAIRGQLLWLEDETRHSNDLLSHLDSLEHRGVDVFLFNF